MKKSVPNSAGADQNAFIMKIYNLLWQYKIIITRNF